MVVYDYYILISLLICGIFKGAQGDNHGACCKVKRITAPDGFLMQFTLVETSAPEAPAICKNSCAYEMTGNPGRKFCFAPSNTFKSECIQSSIPSDFSEVQCGRTREGGCLDPMGGNGRIIGGQEADCNKYPWMAVVLADVGFPSPAPGVPPPKFPVGGGTLINSRHVISAAHVGVNLETLEEFEERDMLVLVGKHDMTQIDTAERAFEVEKKITHPNYDFFRGANDIMILRLRYEVNLHIYTPVCMPPPTVASSTDLVSEKATLTGFGAISLTEDGIPILPRKLQELDDSLTVASSEGCLGWFERQLEENTNLTAQEVNAASEKWVGLKDGNQFCASNEERTSPCIGDSGSPLTYQVDPQVFELLGVVNSGLGVSPCNDTYTVFANVPYFHNWIVGEAGEVFYFNP